MWSRIYKKLWMGLELLERTYLLYKYLGMALLDLDYVLACVS